MESHEEEQLRLKAEIESHHDFETMFMRRDTFAAELSDLVASPKSLTEEEEWFQSVSQDDGREERRPSHDSNNPYASADTGGMTDDELVEAALAQDPDANFSEEERTVRLQDAYWERRADAIMAEADKHNKNRLLSVIEIRTWLDSGHLSKDDKWFCEWLLDDRGVNFHRYDKDHSGEIDIDELKNAVKEWSEYARLETEKRSTRRNAAIARKRELSEERRQMLANADSRAAEIMILCEKNSGDGRNLTVHGLRTYLAPIRKLKPFVDWMLGNRMAVFKKYDKDRSGTIDLEELESALDEYFDEVRAKWVGGWTDGRTEKSPEQCSHNI